MKHKHRPTDTRHGHEHPNPLDHESQHKHSHGRGRLPRAVKEIFRPHSHDSADSIDDALTSDQRGIRAVTISFAALMLTAVLQVAIAILTGSVALAADTIHNFSDALTAVPLFIAFRLGQRPPTRRYTYGYRRAEDLAGLFVLAMILLSAVIAGWQAIERMINPRELEHLGVLFAAGLAGFVGNEIVALYRVREGRAIGSAALVADGHHARTDGFTSLGVAVGAVLVWAGFERADPIIGLVIALAILAVLRGATKQVYYRLMDAVDPSIVDEVERVASSVPEVRSVASTRVRWLGHRLAADITIGVDPSQTVTDGHRIASATHRQLVQEVRYLDHVHVHVHDAGSQADTATTDKIMGSIH